MALLRALVRGLFDRAETFLGRFFPAHWNPLLNLGALGFFFYWIITATGIYVYIFFDTGVLKAYASVEYMTNDQWYAAGIMRSLHRYASDALIVVVFVHIAREFGRDRYRGVRWFSWVTGLPVLILIFFAGISGYWLVWDRLAQYVAIVSTEWLDRLPIFGEPIARNFLSPDTLESRFFSLMIFMHIAIPLIALGLMWLHLQRVIKPRINPPRGLAAGTLLSLLGLSIAYPAVSQGPADLAKVPGTIGLDWFYLPAYPLMETLPGPVTWGAALTFLVIAAAMPWLPPLRKPAPAVVDLANCNGCRRCFEDCPYSAISMEPRTDGRPFAAEAVVDPDLCVACGICAGACPTATPFRRMSHLVPGIDLPDRSIASIRDQLDKATANLTGTQRIVVFGCDHGVPLAAATAHRIATVPLACIGQLPPSFIDYVLARRLADGVILTGCAPNACQNRFGIDWTEQRLAAERDPHLRGRVPRERLRTLWAGPTGQASLDALIEECSADLGRMAPAAQPTSEKVWSREEPVDA